MGLYPRKTRNFELGLPVAPYSNIFYVDSVNGNDDSDGLRPEKPMATILAAYNRCTANQHSVQVSAHLTQDDSSVLRINRSAARESSK